jgi:hypothetical protein
MLGNDAESKCKNCDCFTCFHRLDICYSKQSSGTCEQCERENKQPVNECSEHKDYIPS